MGDSEGSLETVEFGDWVHNAGTVLETLGSADNILVGSSMGGWISLWLASQEKFAEKISGLVVIAPALNFIRPHYELTYRGLSQEDRQRLDNGEVGEPPTMFKLLVHNYCVLSKEKLKTKFAHTLASWKILVPRRKLHFPSVVCKQVVIKVNLLCH